MSISCPDCGAVASYGNELGHKSDCPSIKKPFDFKTLRPMTPEQLEGVRKQPRRILTREEQVRRYAMLPDDEIEAMDKAREALKSRDIPT